MNPRFPLFSNLLRVLLLALTLGLAGSVWADPPGRVGRVADFTGEVWLFDSEAQEWERVDRNQPITTGDRVRSGTGARLSLQIGSSSVWLDERSELVFNRLDDGAVQMQLERGQLALRLRSRDMADDALVQTRDGSFRPQREGLYRVDALDRGSRGFAWMGQLRFDARDPNVPPAYLEAGDEAELWWADGPHVERMRIERDPFADWALAQSNAQDGSYANNFVSPEMTGAADLDSYGSWQDSPDYGPLWFPQNVGPDWAPYRDGRWAWVAPWGWTWVDASPWGFAPFHYGRWVMVGGRWCWAPGRREGRPTYAPALVAWVGGGVLVGGRSAPPRYGWYPLAPREVYQPAYVHSAGYDGRLNVGIDIRIGGGSAPNRYANMPAAVSTLPDPNWRGRPQPYRPDFGPLRTAPAPQRVDAAPGRGQRVEAPPPVTNGFGNGSSNGSSNGANNGAFNGGDGRGRGGFERQPQPMPQTAPMPVQQVRPQMPNSPMTQPQSNAPQAPVRGFDDNAVQQRRDRGGDEGRQNLRPDRRDDSRPAPAPQPAAQPAFVPQQRSQPQPQQESPREPARAEPAAQRPAPQQPAQRGDDDKRRGKPKEPDQR